MTTQRGRGRDPSRRAVITSGAAALGAAATIRPQIVAAAEPLTPAAPVVVPATPPGGYNILFMLVDQEHFFDTWPMPAPGREWIKQNGVTFTNHQAASCVCSPARSTIYTGEHIQFTTIFDNANSLTAASPRRSATTTGTSFRSATANGSFPRNRNARSPTAVLRRFATFVSLRRTATVQRRTPNAHAATPKFVSASSVE
jgi:hypothetical protein